MQPNVYASAVYADIMQLQAADRATGQAPEGEEGIDDEHDGGGVAANGAAEGGPIAVVCNVYQAHPAEGKHDAAQRGRYKEEGQEEPIVALHVKTHINTKNSRMAVI